MCVCVSVCLCVCVCVCGGGGRGDGGARVNRTRGFFHSVFACVLCGCMPETPPSKSDGVHVRGTTPGHNRPRELQENHEMSHMAYSQAHVDVALVRDSRSQSAQHCLHLTNLEHHPRATVASRRRVGRRRCVGKKKATKKKNTCRKKQAGEFFTNTQMTSNTCGKLYGHLWPDMRA